MLLNDDWTKKIFRYIHWEVDYYYFADLSTWVDPFKPKPTKKINRPNLMKFFMGLGF
jgi:hypothetical protein